MRKLLLLIAFLLMLGPPLSAATLSVTLQSGGHDLVDARGARLITVITDPDPATATLAGTGQPLDTETATIGDTVYTIEDGVTETAFAFDLGATLTITLSNFCAAINAGAGSGTAYGSETTAHPTVTCTGSTATTLSIEAITPGSGANTIATTETLTTNAWGGATLVDVTDPVVTISRVDSTSATAHGTNVSTVTDDTPALGVFTVDWPLYYVSVTAGRARVAVAR